MGLRLLALGMFLPAFVFASLDVSPAERVEIDKRLKNFRAAAPTDSSPMMYRTPKYDPVRQEFVHPDTPLKPDDTDPSVPRHPLLQLAGKKASDEYRKTYCEKVLKKHLPGISCEDGWAKIESTAEIDDRFETLTRSWIAADKLTRDMNVLPAKGETSLAVWSDDYWRTRWGLTSYRYATQVQYKKYGEAVASYKQPTEWQGLLGQFPIPQLAQSLLKWSPAEKYDLTVGDENFTLTNQQKDEGKGSLKGDNVEDWMGICHGWATAAIMSPRPDRPLNVLGARGAQVTWYPSDIRAMASLAWANGNARSHYAGGRCDAKNVKTFPNGRIRQQECFDTNPATWHLALANMVGREKLSFVFDKTFDYEIWNQPIYTYQFEYFNPLDPEKKSADWKQVAVDYNDAFKAADRFQHPLTRGKRDAAAGTWDDSKVKKIVGVVSSIVYISEVTPAHGYAPSQENLTREAYAYDLELEEVNGVWQPTGGEWHENSHPDFMWLPYRDAIAGNDKDDIGITYSLKQQPGAKVTESAQLLSHDGFPLCNVVKALVDASSATSVYRCDPSSPVKPRPPQTKPPVTPPPPPPQDDCHLQPSLPAVLWIQAHYPQTEVWIEGQFRGNFQAGSTRQFNSPALDPCGKYQYGVRLVSWKLVGGQYQWVAQEMSVKVRSGKTSKVYLNSDGSYVIDDQ